MEIILASSSPRRQELLKNLGLAYRIIAPDIDEQIASGEDVISYVRRLAREKGEKVLLDIHSVLAPTGEQQDYLIISADTTVYLRPALLGKAETPEQAGEMLAQLRGRHHYVVSALSLIHQTPGYRRKALAHSVSRVFFRPFSDRVLQRYVASGEWQGKAGAYAIQGKGSFLVDSFQGSLTNIIGFPVRLFLRMVSAMEIVEPVMFPENDQL